MADDAIPIRNAIISVYDKSGLDELVAGLFEVSPDLRIYSTGGTHDAIRQMLTGGRKARLLQISDYTGQPEMQGGLVKTLDFRIYLGLLSETYNDSHVADLERTSGVKFDMTVVNLYPFEEASAKAGATIEDARTNIDIGGPTMLRASAKNFLRVLSVCDPSDYPSLLSELRQNQGKVTLATRYRFAQKTFRLIAEYDRAISEYLASHVLPEGAYARGGAHHGS